MNTESIARVCHESNRAYCIGLGDNSQARWEDAPDWQVESAINGVNFHLENPTAGPDHSHIEWMKEKEENGWVYGEEKDPEAKTHPCIVLYEELPLEQRLKDSLFIAIVHALSQSLAEEQENGRQEESE